MKKKLFLILILALTACKEPPPELHMSVSSQCTIYGYWCAWPFCGPCAGDEPQPGSDKWRRQMEPWKVAQ